MTHLSVQSSALVAPKHCDQVLAAHGEKFGAVHTSGLVYDPGGRDKESVSVMLTLSVRRTQYSYSSRTKCGRTSSYCCCVQH